MATDQESTQLPLSVKVSSWSGFKYGIKKSIREFKYTPFVQVISHILFWINGGIIAGVFAFLQMNKEVVKNGIGVVLLPAARSHIPFFVSSSVANLSILMLYWYGMIALLAVFMVVSMIAHSSGRYSMATYLLMICLILEILLAKAIVMPILLIGG